MSTVLFSALNLDGMGQATWFEQETSEITIQRESVISKMRGHAADPGVRSCTGGPARMLTQPMLANTALSPWNLGRVRHGLGDRK